MEVLA